MNRLRLSLACGRYDRTEPLFDERVVPEGIELLAVPVHAAEIFLRMVHHAEFDAAEMSLASFLMGLSSGDDRFVGIPAFPSRMFRHRDIYVHTDSGLQRPEDLRGARVGLRRYHMTSSLWQRGLLADDHGVEPHEIRWVKAGIDRAGSVPPRRTLRLRQEIQVEVVTDRSIDEMLVDGALDAALLNHPPASFRRGHPKIRRLFAEPRNVELDYYRRTGIFPIMHLVVIRRDVLEREPWVAQSLLKAFEEAKRLAFDDMAHDTGTSVSSLPFFHLELEQTRATFGADFWPYGTSANLHTLQAALRYVFDQGLAARPVELEELFAPGTLEVGGRDRVDGVAGAPSAPGDEPGLLAD